MTLPQFKDKLYHGLFTITTRGLQNTSLGIILLKRFFYRSNLKVSKAKKKFYAVACGRTPGIYNKWYGEGGAEAQVKSFPDARYQGFATIKKAQVWLKEFNLTKPVQPSLFPELETSEPEPQEPDAGHASEKIDTRQELKMGKVIIYTDGGCINNPGPGGYGAILMFGKKRQELSGGFRLTTNNRMELTACIEGLKLLKKPCSVILFSDSQYVVNGIKKGWAKRWRRKNWMRNQIQPAENADLWKQLLDLCDKHHVEFFWVKGHAGQPENERCDQLAKQAAADGKNQSKDIAFETGQTTVSSA
jgi:ribonuclease HI